MKRFLLAFAVVAAVLMGCSNGKYDFALSPSKITLIKGDKKLVTVEVSPVLMAADTTITAVSTDDSFMEILSADAETDGKGNITGFIFSGLNANKTGTVTFWLINNTNDTQLSNKVTITVK